MINTLGRRVAAMLLACALLPASRAMAAPPLADFFKKPQISAPRVSPDGRYLAVLLSGDEQLARLAIMDLEQLGPPKIIAGFERADVGQHAWVNDNRLVYSIGSSERSPGRGAEFSGLWAVDRDGGNRRELIIAGFKNDAVVSRIADRRLEGNWQLDAVPHDGSDEVIVTRLRWSHEPESLGLGLARLDTRNGALRVLHTGAPDYVDEWFLDTQGQPVALATVKAGRYTSYLRGAGDRWQVWQEAEHLRGQFDQPFWFGPEGQDLVLSTVNGFDVLRRMDRKTRKVEEAPLVSFKGYDFRGRLVFDKIAGQLLGLHYETDAPSSLWLHPQLKAWQAKIDAALPGSVNRLQCQRCLTARQLLVTAQSDQRPEAYFLFDTASGELKLLAASRPWIQPTQMGQRDMFRVKARDGLELPVLVTQPAAGSKGPHPAVVLVHGGPFVRGSHWPWEAQAQFLASRGYLVIEPEFRGSTGYGFKHFQAGWKQWGLAMQDDLVDALQWAVGKGLADPRRVCIAGASYGGYATLMGLIKHGEQFRCGVSWAGVTDIGLLHSIHWSDLSDEWTGYGLPILVGDPVKDAQQLRSTSPLQRAHEIKRPLLMAYGAGDRRVPIEHGNALKAALAAEQPLEWVVYPDEGHGWSRTATQLDFWQRVEHFLGRHLGAGADRP